MGLIDPSPFVYTLSLTRSTLLLKIVVFRKFATESYGP